MLASNLGTCYNVLLGQNAGGRQDWLQLLGSGLPQRPGRMRNFCSV